MVGLLACPIAEMTRARTTVTLKTSPVGGIHLGETFGMAEYLLGSPTRLWMRNGPLYWVDFSVGSEPSSV